MSNRTSSAIVVAVMMFAACGDRADGPGQEDQVNIPDATVTPDGGFLFSADSWWRTSRSDAADFPDPGFFEDSAAIGMDMLLSRAQVVLRGSVSAVDGPFWNQANGQFWDRVPSEDYALQGLYREVTLDVSEVLWDDFGAAAAARPFQFITYGDGQGSDPRHGGLSGDGAHFAIGDEVVVLLEWRAYGLRETGVDVYLVGHPPWGVLNLQRDGRYAPQLWQADPQMRFPTIDARVSFLYSDGAWSLDELKQGVEAAKLIEVPPDLLRQYPALNTSRQTNQNDGVADSPACLNVPRGDCQ